MNPLVIPVFGIILWLLLSSSDEDTKTAEKEDGKSQVLAHDGGSGNRVRNSGLVRNGHANGAKSHRTSVKRKKKDNGAVAESTTKEIHHHHYHDAAKEKESTITTETKANE